MYIAASYDDQGTSQHILPARFQEVNLALANVYHQFVIGRDVILRHVRKLATITIPFLPFQNRTKITSLPAA